MSTPQLIMIGALITFGSGHVLHGQSVGNSRSDKPAATTSAPSGHRHTAACKRWVPARFQVVVEREWVPARLAKAPGPRGSARTAYTPGHFRETRRQQWVRAHYTFLCGHPE